MNKIIEMAHEVKMPYDFVTGEPINIEKLEAFAALVRADERNRTWTQEHWTEYERSIAAAEREECAKLCDDILARCIAKDVEDPPLEHIAAAIRERGRNAS
jgi:hypothetical protein